MSKPRRRRLPLRYSTPSATTRQPGLTRDDIDNGPGWLIIGVRPGGNRLVIENAADPAAAQCRAEFFRSQLEGYAEIRVEAVGSPEREVPMNDTAPPSTNGHAGKTGEQIVREEMERRQAGKPGVAAIKSRWEGIRQHTEATRKLVQQCGPDATFAEVQAEAQAQGIEITQAQFWKRRKDLGFVTTPQERGQRTARGRASEGSAAPAPIKPRPLPEVPAPEDEPEDDGPPVPYHPAAVEPLPDLEAVAEIAALAERCGGLDRLRRLTETLETIWSYRA